jgi:putative transposase
MRDYEFRRQLEYKTSWYGSELKVIPRFFPSSKRCSKGGFVKKELPLSKRVFLCEQCGFRINRDLNASYSLLTVAVSSTKTLNAWHETGGYSLRAVPVNDAGTEHRISSCKFRGTEIL